MCVAPLFLNREKHKCMQENFSKLYFVQDYNNIFSLKCIVINLPLNELRQIQYFPDYVSSILEWCSSLFIDVEKKLCWKFI